MMTMIEGKPGHAMTLPFVPFAERSIVPATEQERVRLLLEMKHAQDFYVLEFAMAEHTGFVRGLFMALEISSAQLTIFQHMAKRVWTHRAEQLAKEVA